MIVAINAIHAKGGGGLTYLRNLLPVLPGLALPGEKFLVLGRREQADLVPEPSATMSFEPVAAPLSTVGSMIWEQARLPSLGRRLGVDVLYCPQNFYPLAWRRPAVILLRNSLEAGRQARGLYQKAYWRAYSLLTGLCLRRAARVLCVSRTMADEARRLYGLPASFPIDVVPHGLHPRFTPGPPGPHPLASRGGGPYFLFVSTIFRHKNLHGLVAAFGQIAREMPEMRLAVVGLAVDPAYIAEVETVARESGVEGRLVWAGAVGQQELPDWYRHATALVFPSFAESFGNPPLEAMACGTPVLAARAGAMPELCAGAALYFDPRSSQEIAERMRAVARDEGLASRLREGGRERSRHFRWEASASGLLAGLRAACATPPAVSGALPDRGPS